MSGSDVAAVVVAMMMILGPMAAGAKERHGRARDTRHARRFARHASSKIARRNSSAPRCKLAAFMALNLLRLRSRRNGTDIRSLASDWRSSL